jgi:hypothetical protein
MFKKRMILVVVISLIVVLLTAGCTKNPMIGQLDETGHVADFWDGIGDGFLFSYKLLISIFTNDITPYNAFNVGGWYNFGMFLGSLVSGLLSIYLLSFFSTQMSTMPMPRPPYPPFRY